MATNDKKTSPAAQIPPAALAEPSDRIALNLKHQERKAQAKLERIKKWPKEHQEEAIERAQSKLNNIREEMKKRAS